MLIDNKVPLFELVLSLSKAVDLISPTIAEHQIKVAYIAYIIGKETGLKKKDLDDIVMAGALHDIGAFSLNDKMNALLFEVKNPHQHAEMGYHLLKKFKPFARVAEMVRYHHVPWDNGGGEKFKDNPVPAGSHILHLSDRIAVSIKADENILGQRDRVIGIVKKNSGLKFKPELVDVFLSIGKKESFWLHLSSLTLNSSLASQIKIESIELDNKVLLSLAKLFSHIIDFRNPFTATHSSGVAAVAEELYRLIGMSPMECARIKIAGYLHDLGKLAVPPEILQKVGDLDQNELNIIRAHTFYTYNVLKNINGLNDIIEWAACHHERMDGGGYPFCFDSGRLTTGARIMTIADIFTALMEDRPYRKGLSEIDALQIIKDMADNNKLDAIITSILSGNISGINAIRIKAQKEADSEYRLLREAGLITDS